MNFNTPILLLIFNRPKETERVFNEIRKHRPSQLFIAADGPRIGVSEDVELCSKCRDIVKSIDWDCQLITLFRDENLGCGEGPANAITWFFDQVEAGIILEDDCLPNKSFFLFCETLLNRYALAEEIMMICGTSYQPKPLDGNSYYFSNYAHAWGWATWRSAWNKYAYSLENEATSTISAVINQTFSNKRERKLWAYNMGIIKRGLDAWDYQWMYWIWKNNGLTIIPWKNTISNIGFGNKATHTLDALSEQSQMTQYELETITHPKHIVLNHQADRYERFHVLIPTASAYYQGRLKAAVKKILRLLHIIK